MMLEYQIRRKGDILVLNIVGGDVPSTEIPGLMPLDLPDTDKLPVVVKGDGLNPILMAVVVSALDAPPWVAIWDDRTKSAVVVTRVCADGTVKLGKMVYL